jgi:two-component system, NtrC family, sensor kinase
LKRVGLSFTLIVHSLVFAKEPSVMKILVAEDSTVMRLILVHSLKAWQYEIVETADGTEAWERFQQERFPLVLTDWMMPEMNGLELVKKIRASDSADYTYIIILTAKTDKEDLVEAMEAGADDFLIKPCDPNELRVRVREGERIINLEQRLAEQNRQLRDTQAALVQSEKLASLGQLAAGMAHEVNNPISYVANNLTVLRRDVTSLTELLAKYRVALESLQTTRPDLANEMAQWERECDLEWVQENLPLLFKSSLDGISRIRDIVKNLRDFARLDEAEFDELDLNAAVRSTVEVLAHELEATRVAVEFSLCEELPRVLCRPAKIHQVLYNLLLNAIQACQPEGHIVVRTSTENNENVTVEVDDHGCGIAPEHLPHIFEPFFTTRPVGGGAGLGLAISYGIVRAHGGSIEVESKLGCGSTFRVRLPLKPLNVGDIRKV